MPYLVVVTKVCEHVFVPIVYVKKIDYKPVELDKGVVSDKLPVPFFTLEVDEFVTQDQTALDAILKTLKAEKLYKKGLIFTGIYGGNLKKTGSFGSRKETYAVTEKAFRKSLRSSRPWRKAFDNNPFLHMRVEGKKTPTIAVFDGSKMVSGEFFNEPKKVHEADRIAWWPRDGASLDQAAVAVFYFKNRKKSY